MATISSTLVKGTYGVIFRFGCSFDLTSESSLTLTFLKPTGALLEKTAGVAVGNGDVVTPAGTFLSGQYATYQFVVGDLDEAGQWQVSLTYENGAQHLVSLPGTFLVQESLV